MLSPTRPYDLSFMSTCFYLLTCVPHFFHKLSFPVYLSTQAKDLVGITSPDGNQKDPSSNNHCLEEGLQ